MTLTAALFVGGLSRRMGADKATLVTDGEPLWARQLRTLRETGPDVLLVSARSRPSWCPKDIEVVLDEAPSRGPMSGLVAALKGIKTSHLLVLAIDLPAINSAHLRKLWSMAKPGCGVMPYVDGRAEPLCAIYPVEAVKIVGEFFAGEDTALRPVAKRLSDEKLVLDYHAPQDERGFYRNVNSPGDLVQ